MSDSRKNHKSLHNYFSDEYNYETIHKNGRFKNNELGIDWEVRECEVETLQEYYSNKLNKELEKSEIEWHSIEDGIMEENVLYDIELYDGGIVSSLLLDEENGLFFNESEEISVDEVKNVRRIVDAV